MNFDKIWPLIIGLALPLLMGIIKRLIGKATWPGLVDAINRGDVDDVKKLLAKGAPVNEKDEHLGRTPLIMASMTGHTEIVKMLLERGADPNGTDMEGWTAIRYAHAYGHDEIVELLRNAGARE
jgi:ankyrin repeat protein